MPVSDPAMRSLALRRTLAASGKAFAPAYRNLMCKIPSKRPH